MRCCGFAFSKLPETEQINLIQPVSLYKSFFGKEIRYYLALRNKKSKRLYMWDYYGKENISEGKWNKARRPRTELEATSPLDFLVNTGKTFRSSVERDFGLEYIETEAEIQKQREMGCRGTTKG